MRASDRTDDRAHAQPPFQRTIRSRAAASGRKAFSTKNRVPASTVIPRVCSRKPTTIDSPKRKEMRDKIYAKKYEQTSNNYLAEIRKAAMIEYRETSAEDSNAEDGKKSKPRRN